MKLLVLSLFFVAIIVAGCTSSDTSNQTSPLPTGIIVTASPTDVPIPTTVPSELEETFAPVSSSVTVVIPTAQPIESPTTNPVNIPTGDDPIIGTWQLMNYSVPCSAIVGPTDGHVTCGYGIVSQSRDFTWVDDGSGNYTFHMSTGETGSANISIDGTTLQSSILPDGASLKRISY